MRNLLILSCIFLSLATPTSYAVDSTVKSACQADYFQYCAHTVPGGSACRKCFRKYAIVLTSTCKMAIKNSPEYAIEYQEEYNRRHTAQK